MLASGESQKEVIRPDFNRAIMIDFQGAKITSEVGFLLVREIDKHFRIIDPMHGCLEDVRPPVHQKLSMVQRLSQKVYQIVASYEDFDGVKLFRIDLAFGLPPNRG
jgi:hypothetical protein